MAKIIIGGDLKKKNAGDVKALLTKRYTSDSYKKLVKDGKAPEVSKEDINACISDNFGEDEGAAKLNISNPKKSSGTHGGSTTGQEKSSDTAKA